MSHVDDRAEITEAILPLLDSENVYEDGELTDVRVNFSALASLFQVLIEEVGQSGLEAVLSGDDDAASQYNAQAKVLLILMDLSEAVQAQAMLQSVNVVEDLL